MYTHTHILLLSRTSLMEEALFSDPLKWEHWKEGDGRIHEYYNKTFSPCKFH
jgi:hypothetical protein